MVCFLLFFSLVSFSLWASRHFSSLPSSSSFVRQPFSRTLNAIAVQFPAFLHRRKQITRHANTICYYRKPRPASQFPSFPHPPLLMGQKQKEEENQKHSQ
ncbi:hypothetical protein V8C37DRAFT_390115 [Trichoderma ceciliae]